jgi:hypothetical protein
MPAETAEDLAALFHPDDFGVEMFAFIAASTPSPGSLMTLNETTLAVPQVVGVPFMGIQTTGYVGEGANAAAVMTPTVSMMAPRIIARKAALPDLAQNDEIELPGGRRVIVNDVHYKGELIIIHYHEHW